MKKTIVISTALAALLGLLIYNFTKPETELNREDLEVIKPPTKLEIGTTCGATSLTALIKCTSEDCRSLREAPLEHNVTLSFVSMTDEGCLFESEVVHYFIAFGERNCNKAAWRTENMEVSLIAPEEEALIKPEIVNGPTIVHTNTNTNGVPSSCGFKVTAIIKAQ